MGGVDRVLALGIMVVITTTIMIPGGVAEVETSGQLSRAELSEA